MKAQRGFIHLDEGESLFLLVLAVIVVALAGGFVVYVAIPWLWAVAIKPALLWLLT